MTELERKLYLLALEVMLSPTFDDAHQVDIISLAQRDGIAEPGDIFPQIKRFRPALDSLEKQGYLVRAVNGFEKNGKARNSWVPVDLLTALSMETG